MWKEAEEFLLGDKHIGPLIKKYGHCKIRKSKKTDYFNDIASSIIEQQLSGKAATAIYERIKRVVGVGAGRLTPDSILSITDEKLRSAGISWAKVKYVKDLSKKVKNGEVEIHKMNKLSDEKVMEELVKVKGIGMWTAEMFLMFSLARPDIFPSDDLGIKNGIKKIFGKELSRKKMDKKALKWKPYRTAASWYVWRSLENR